LTHGQSLAQTIEATQQSLERRLRDAVAPHRDPNRPREAYADTDTFMAATSRHLAAVDAVLLPAVGHAAPDGDTLVHEYLEVAKQLELTLSRLKARLYGEAHAIYRSWPALWEEAQERLERHNRLEMRVLETLLQHGDPDELDELAERLFHAETRAPTRPHPYTPHTGWVSGLSRRLWALADRFWDNAEGRMIPDPVRPAHHQHDSLVAQYLVADPQFDDNAAIVGHRGRHRPDADS
jgi:hypothetical protein